VSEKPSILCQEQGCENNLVARGLCSKHYQRERSGGMPVLPKKTIEDRFWEKVDKSDGCWKWKGHLSKASMSKGGGYGRLLSGGRQVLAHRSSFQIHFGEIPEGMNVCHTCDNRACVNPKHLFLGTQSDNLIDALKKGRAPNTKLTEPDVLKIKQCEGMFLREIADKFDVSISQVWNIRSGNHWSHV